MQLAVENLFTALAFVIYNAFVCISFYIYYLQSAAYRLSIKKLFLEGLRETRQTTVTVAFTATNAVMSTVATVG
jgi:hypothetical protein